MMSSRNLALAAGLAAVFIATGPSRVTAAPLTAQTLGLTSDFFADPPAVVGAGIEFFYEIINPTDGLAFDFDETGLLSVYLTRTGGTHAFGGSAFFVTFSDIFNAIPAIIGFTLVSVDAGITGLTQSDLSFTADSATIIVGGTLWPGATPPRIAQFRLDFEAVQAVPEPVTLLLLGTGLGAIAARRRIAKRA